MWCGTRWIYYIPLYTSIYLYIPLYTFTLYIPFHPTSVAIGTHRPSWTLNVVHKAHQCLRFHASHSNTIKLLFGKIDPCWVRCEIWLLMSAQETGTWGFREEQLLVDHQQLCCWCQSACSNRSPSEAATYWAWSQWRSWKGGWRGWEMVSF